MRLFSRIAFALLLATSVALAQQTVKPAKSRTAKSTKVDAGLKKYGNVAFADPDHHKYPIDNPSHIRAAWSSIHQKSHAAKYKPEDLTAIRQRIHDAGMKQGIKFSDEKPKASKRKTIKSPSK